MAVRLVQEEKVDASRDILSLMVIENRKVEEKDRLGEDEMVDQVTTFLAAGHETTSLAVSPSSTCIDDRWLGR